MTELLREANFEVECVNEATDDGKKNWYIEGIFLQADVVNRNHRVYPKAILENKIQEFQRDYVSERRAVGELSHPSTVEINPDRISHRIDHIKQDGSNFIGRARITTGTPCGSIVAGLLEDGIKLGVSSRAIGSVKKNSRGINEVQDDFQLGAVDIVFHPSAPDAFVEGMMENAAFLTDTISEDTDFIRQVEESKQEIQETSSKDLEQKKLEVFERFMNRTVAKL